MQKPPQNIPSPVGLRAMRIAKTRGIDLSNSYFFNKILLDQRGFGSIPGRLNGTHEEINRAIYDETVNYCPKARKFLDMDLLVNLAEMPDRGEDSIINNHNHGYNPRTGEGGATVRIESLFRGSVEYFSDMRLTPKDSKQKGAKYHFSANELLARIFHYIADITAMHTQLKHYQGPPMCFTNPIKFAKYIFYEIRRLRYKAIGKEVPQQKYRRAIWVETKNGPKAYVGGFEYDRRIIAAHAYLDIVHDFKKHNLKLKGPPEPILERNFEADFGGNHVSVSSVLEGLSHEIHALAEKWHKNTVENAYGWKLSQELSRQAKNALKASANFLLKPFAKKEIFELEIEDKLQAQERIEDSVELGVRVALTVLSEAGLINPEKDILKEPAQ